MEAYIGAADHIDRQQRDQVGGDLLSGVGGSEGAAAS